MSQWTVRRHRETRCYSHPYNFEWHTYSLVNVRCSIASCSWKYKVHISRPALLRFWLHKQQPHTPLIPPHCSLKMTVYGLRLRTICSLEGIFRLMEPCLRHGSSSLISSAMSLFLSFSPPSWYAPHQKEEKLQVVGTPSKGGIGDDRPNPACGCWLQADHGRTQGDHRSSSSTGEGHLIGCKNESLSWSTVRIL